MKITQSKLKMLLLFFVAVAGFLVINSSSAFATARTWTGTAGDKKLATAGNWNPSGSPATGDTLTISFATLFSSGCTADITLNNDVDPAGVTLGGMTFTGARPAECYKILKFSGNEIKTSGNITISGNTTPSPLLNVTLTATANITIQSVDSTALLNVGSHTVSLTDGSYFGSASGSGSLVLSTLNGGKGGGGCGDGTGSSYPITGDGSSFTGTIVSNQTGLTVSARTNDIARHASSITINSGGYLGLYLNRNQDMSLSTPITFNGGRVSAFQASASSGNNCLEPTAKKTVTLSGSTSLTQNTTFSPYLVDIKFTGSVTGADKAKIASGVTGTITLPNGGTSTSPINVHEVTDSNNCGFLYSSSVNNKDVINADCSAGITYDSQIKGSLGGSGKLGGGVKILDGGIIAPGNSPGTLSVGDLEFEEGGIYDFEIAGNDEGQYDQINVTGTVTLGNGKLRTFLLDGFTPEQGKSFVIINNDGSDAVNGTFAGLSEGATVEVDGVGYFTISYTGGDGNDVVLTAIPGVANTGDFKKSANLGFLAGSVLIVGIVAVKSKKLLLKRR